MKPKDFNSNVSDALFSDSQKWIRRLALAALLISMSLGGSPAFAVGGAGGPGGLGGVGGADNPSGAGGAGAVVVFSGGGGGGAGITGGDGGDGDVVGGGSGGSGGVSAGDPGTNGGDAGFASGGGGGGAHGFSGAALPSAAVTGGAGGNGGSGAFGGGGGAGGWGAVVSGTGSLGSLGFDVTGGAGGAGGGSTNGGNGGSGGVGLAFTVGAVDFTIDSAVAGGAGGTGGTGGAITGIGGSGGAGLTGSDLTITMGTTGTISGGLDGDGGNRADAITFTGGSNVLTFNGANSGLTGNIGNNGTLLTFQQSTNTTVNNIITGTGGVTKQGAGILTLTAANTYTGGITLSEGTLVIGNDSALGTGTLTIEDGTFLNQTAGLKTIANNIVLNGNFTRNVGVGDILDINGNIDLGSGIREITNNGWTLRLDGAISGSGGLTLSGPNPFIMGGNSSNSYTGLTTVRGSNGLSLSKSAGNTAIAGDLTIDAGSDVSQSFTSNQIADTSTVTVNGDYELSDSSEAFQTLLGSGTITGSHFSGDQTLGIQDGDFSGIIEDDGSFDTQLIKTGSGTLILSGANTYRGGTTISGGTLQIGDGGATGIVAGDITNNSELIFDRSGDYFYNGSVSGTGNFTQNLGILRLSEAQTYIGITRIHNNSILVLPFIDQSLSSATTVDVGAGSILDISNSLLTISGLTGSGTVYSFLGASPAAGNLTLDIASGTSTFGGSFGGTFANFSITKAGAGTQILTGTSTHTGTTTVSGGSLIVNGNLGNSAVTVQNSALLGGSGILGGNVTVQSGGILSPGNSTGIINIGGDLNLDSGSTTQMEINGTTPGTEHDQIVVGGTATLGGTLELYLGGGLSSGDSFTLIDTPNAIVGDFDSVVNVLGNALTFTSTITDDYLLNITAVQSDFEPFALTPNQTVIAKAIDDFALSGDINGLIDFLNTLPGTSLPAAFDQLAPTRFAFLATSAFANSRNQLSNLSGQMSSRRGGSSGLKIARMNVSTAARTELLQPVASEEWSFFVNGTGTFSDVNGAGYDSDSGGLLFGTDLKTSDSSILGFYAGYDRTELDFGRNGGGIDSDSAKYGFYGTWFNQSGSWLEGALGGGTHDYKSTRRTLGGDAIGDTEASEFLLSLMAGQDFRFGARKEWALTPSVGLSYNRLKTDSFTEQGSLAPLAMPEQKFESLQSQIGLRLSNRRKWAGYDLISHVNLGWRQELLDPSQSIDARFAAGGSLFTVNGTSAARGTATFGAGVNALLSDSLSIGLGYNGEYNSDISVHQVNASLRFDF